jgi:hypothetical protein
VNLSLALDLLLVVLLAASIGYAVVLNRKLSSLRQHKDDLEKLAATFVESTTRAEDSIQRLKGTTTQLQNGIEAADGLREDLTYLIDRGTTTADRLEGAIRGSRDVDGAAADSGIEKEKMVGIETIADVAFDRESAGQAGAEALDKINAAEDVDNEESRAQAERDLIEALRQVR